MFKNRRQGLLAFDMAKLFWYSLPVYTKEYHFSVINTTDFAGSSACSSLPCFLVPSNFCGTMVLGLSNVLISVKFAAVSISPSWPCQLMPGKLMETVIFLAGSRFTSE